MPPGPSSRRLRPATLLATGLPILLALAGFAFVLAANYPGYLNGDSRHQLEEAITGHFGDWHSPTVTLIWRGLLNVLPGPVGFITLDNLLIWGALAGLALALRRPLGAWSTALMAVPLLPGTVNYLGHVHVDAMLAAVLLAGVCLAYLARRDGQTPRTQRALQLAANAVIALAFLIRLNAIFGLIPLLLYANGRRGLKRAALVSAAVLACLPVLYSVQNTALGVKPSHPGDSIKVYHLLALSYHDRKNLFPGTWSPEQSRQIVESCYSPVQWDTASPWGQCRFIAETLRAQGLWGSSTLTQAWLATLASRPASHFVMLMPTFRLSMFDPNSRTMLYNVANRWGWAVDDDPPRPATALLRDYVESPFNDRVGRPWVFALLSILGVTLALRRNLHAHAEGQLALAVLLSGLTYLATFFFVSVSAEYRYFYWSGFAAYLGLGLVLLAGRRRPAAGAPPPPGRAAAWVRHASLLLAAFVLAMLVVPFNLLTVKRLISLTPLESKVVGITRIGPNSTPTWMWRPFEGDISAMTWAWFGDAYRSAPRTSPLIIQTDGLRQDLVLHFETGPDRGRVAIDTPGRHLEIDTHAAAAGTLPVTLPPPAEGRERRRRFNRESILFALATLGAVWFLLRRLARPH